MVFDLPLFRLEPTDQAVTLVCLVYFFGTSEPTGLTKAILRIVSALDVSPSAKSAAGRRPRPSASSLT